MTDEQKRSLVLFYVKEVKRGTRQLEQVPEVIRKQVEDELMKSK